MTVSNNKMKFGPTRPRSLPQMTRKTGIRNVLTNNQRVMNVARINTVPTPLYATKTANNKRPAPQRAIRSVGTPITQWESPGQKKRATSPLRKIPMGTNFIGESSNVHALNQPNIPEEIMMGGACGCSLSRRGGMRHQNRRGLGSGYSVAWTRRTCRSRPANKRNKNTYKKWLAGRSIGFTQRSHLKALGLIPRSNGTCKVSPKYR